MGLSAEVLINMLCGTLYVSHTFSPIGYVYNAIDARFEKPVHGEICPADYGPF